MVHHLGAEQRRAVELLAGAGQRGLTEGTLLRVHGFTFELLTGLVQNGLAAVATGTARVGGRQIKVARIRITAAGRSCSRRLTSAGHAASPV
jgi:hypothetical protein